MKANTATHGATLILVVLFTLLLMAVVLASTMRLGLASRQTTGDQKAILQAQYGAESKVNLIRSKLKDIQTILQYKNAAGTTYLRIPTGTTTSTMEELALKFCGKVGVTNAWSDTAEFAAARSANDATPFPKAKECKVNSSSTLTMNKFDVLVSATRVDGYSVLPLSERPTATATDAQKRDWWNEFMHVSTTTTKYEIKPIRVVRLNSMNYRFYLGLRELKAKGGEGNSTRVMGASRTGKGDWWFGFKVLNPFDYTVFDNTQPATGSGFYQNVFDGDYFTNHKPRFLGGSNVSWLGDMYSAGCGTFPLDSAPDDEDCTGKVPGYFRNVSGNNPGGILVSTTLATEAERNNYLTGQIENQSTFAAGKSGRFSEQYIKLPIKATDQKDAAASGGITLSNSENIVEIFAGDNTEKPFSDPNDYDDTGDKWNEPATTYQYIKLSSAGTSWYNITQAQYNVTPSQYRRISYGKTQSNLLRRREFRLSADGKLYKKDASGSYSVLERSSFNGVLYSTNDIRVTGPARLNGNTAGDLSQIPPALTSFSTMNIATEAGIFVESDLAMSNTPCDNQAVQNNQCPKNNAEDTTPNNVLGLFAASGDMHIAPSTPDNVTIHAAMMASQGGLIVDESSTRPMQGSIKITGSVVENAPKVKGSIRNNALVSGYTPSYSYDNRYKSGILPPYPPVKIVWQAGNASSSDKDLTDIALRQLKSGDF